MKSFRKAKNTLFGGAIALQSTRVLSDRSVGGLTGTATGLGVAGATSNVAMDMVSGKFAKKMKRRKYR